MNQDETNILKANLLRINARNLRAKVRSMLPLDICCKYKARNMLVKEIDYKKKTWQKKAQQRKENPQIWSRAQSGKNSLFFDTFVKAQPRHMFAKLSKKEIDQICDHKHYFLGQNHLSDFEQFLNPKVHCQQLKPTSSVSLRKYRSQNITKQSDLKPSTSLQRTRQKDSSYSQRWYSTQLRIKDLREESTNDRNTKKIMIDLRHKRAQNNAMMLREMRDSKMELRREKRVQMQNKINQKRKLSEQDLQIEQLTLKLKSVCCFNQNSKLPHQKVL